MFKVANLTGGYGLSQALHGVNFEVFEGEVVTLLGRNGAGKSSTLRAIMGMLSHRQGSIQFRGRELIDLPTRTIARLGIGYCPEERAVFSSLSVEENLLLPPRIADGGMAVAQIYELFPNLESRKASPGTRLSGGEQQMLAIARILRTGAKLLLLDEPTEGLAPVIVQQIGRTIATLKEQGYTIVLVEQNIRFAAKVADRHYVVDQGVIVDEFDAAEVGTHMSKLQAHL
ncbi:ABC transporter ATP-binding protein [Pseudoxanthobacter sp. M-2]|uniref:ABC transporter ATP-binding protein n=1 Tax=Pseudoxanthobacter sp. M-2 TaxID=3078754 RepID=UPI0038FCF8D4